MSNHTLVDTLPESKHTKHKYIGACPACHMILCDKDGDESKAKCPRCGHTGTPLAGDHAWRKRIGRHFETR